VARRASDSQVSEPVSLLIIEGETEEIFYGIVRDTYLKGIRLHVQNLKGRGNINKDVFGKIQQYLHNNPNETVRVYCCIDSERDKRTAVQLDLDLIRALIKQRNLNSVLSIDAMMADPELESWFFYDFDGICKFLGAGKGEASRRKYANPTNLAKRDLENLFSRFQKAYISGKRARNLIENLDIGIIVDNCPVLKSGIETIKLQAKDTTNHIF